MRYVKLTLHTKIAFQENCCIVSFEQLLQGGLTMSKKAAAPTYSIWLMPDRKTAQYSELRDMISDLAAVFHTPRFEPHIALVAGIDLPLEECLAKALRVAGRLAPFEIRFGAFGSKQLFPQALYVGVEKTTEFLEACVNASDVFGKMDGDSRYHLPLTYGDLTKAQSAVLLDEAKQHPCNPRDLDCIIWGLSVWKTPHAHVRNWEEVRYFPFTL